MRSGWLVIASAANSCEGERFNFGGARLLVAIPKGEASSHELGIGAHGPETIGEIALSASAGLHSHDSSFNNKSLIPKLVVPTLQSVVTPLQILPLSLYAESSVKESLRRVLSEKVRLPAGCKLFGESSSGVIGIVGVKHCSSVVVGVSSNTSMSSSLSESGSFSKQKKPW